MAELAAGIIESNGWPELLPFIFQCVQSGQDGLMESAFFMQAAAAVLPPLGAQAAGPALMHAGVMACPGS